jgi:hypothetical protein
MKIDVSLCNLGVLCVSVVKKAEGKNHHRDAENTEVAQRKKKKSSNSAAPDGAAGTISEAFGVGQRFERAEYLRIAVEQHARAGVV